MKHLRMGCVAGRHDIKQATDGYLFEKIDDVHDYEYMRDVIELTLFHYDRETGEYKAQVIVSDGEAELLKEGK